MWADELGPFFPSGIAIREPQNVPKQHQNAISDSLGAPNWWYKVVQGWYEAGNMWANVFGPFFHPELPSGSPRMANKVIFAIDGCMEMAFMDPSHVVPCIWV